MILASLSDSTLYEGLHPRFRQAFDYLKQHDLLQAPVGKTVLDGDKLFISVSEVTGKTPEIARVETHENYIDIQMPLSAPETMGWIASEACVNVTNPYNPDKDIAFFADKPTAYVNLQPGQFAIFFPHDGHAPCIGEGIIKKVVVKVLI